MQNTNKITVEYSITESCTYDGTVRLTPTEFARLKSGTDEHIGDVLSFYAKCAKRDYIIHRFAPKD